MCSPLNCFHAVKTLRKIVFITISLEAPVSLNVNLNAAYLKHMSYRNLLYTLHFATLYLYIDLIEIDVCRPFCSLTFLPTKETIFSHNWCIFRILKGPSQFYWDYGSFSFPPPFSGHHFDHPRTRGPQFCLWLMWPQPIVIAIDCNFPHIWFSQCWDVFCQLHFHRL